MNVVVEYHVMDVDKYHVVGFYVEPFSVKHEFGFGMPWDPEVMACFLPSFERERKNDPRERKNARRRRRRRGRTAEPQRAR